MPAYEGLVEIRRTGCVKDDAKAASCQAARTERELAPCLADQQLLVSAVRFAVP
jgi:hypothetical protein